MRTRSLPCGLTALTLLLCVPALGQAQEPATDEQEQVVTEAPVTEDAAGAEEEPLDLPEQVVTGSRLEGGDPSARIYSYTAEEIAGRGVSTLEEFFRTLPWAYPSITTQTNTSLHYDGTDQKDEYIELGLGISTVNLRNMGSANTLVLMNGRRIAGAGEEDDFANILNVPLSAIERVDIQLDGASAVYGSDAIGGVVNFITKKNYTGLSVDYRHEFSATDADQTTASITGGYAWGSGNVTAIVSHETSVPITNSKTGLTTLDFRPRLGPEFDLRSYTTGQPGVVCEFEAPSWAPTLFRCVRNAPRYQLPANHSGAGATVEDFIQFARGEPSPTPYDVIAPQNGEESSTDSFTMNVEQYLMDNLRVYADLVYSKRDSYQEYTPRIAGVVAVPSTNAYNPFGRPMIVQYAAVRESDSGLLPAPFTEAVNERRDLNLGLIWAFGGSHELSLEVTRTASERETYRLRARGIRPRWDPTADAYYAALTSSDPGSALNVFGNGEAQTSVSGFLTTTQGPIVAESETRQYNLTLRGGLFDMWGGRASYTAGAESRENIVFKTRNFTTSSSGRLYENVEDTGSKIGVDKPSREIMAYYAELALPFVGAENARPGVHSLILSLQARYDENESTGSAYIGTRGAYLSFEDLDPLPVPYWHPEGGWLIYNQRQFVFHYADVVHDFNYTTTKQSRTSPSVGLRYQPTGDFTLRARWSRSFRPPVWSDQYATCIDPPPDSFCSPDTRFRTSFNNGVDPYHPDGPTEFSLPFGGVVRQVYNTELKNEFSDTVSVGFDWSPAAIPGLRWTLDWSETDFTNRIEDGIAVAFMAQDRPELIMNHPQVVTRNAEGDIESLLFLPININAKYSELVDTGLQYSFSTAFGSFTPRLAYTRVLADHIQVGPTEESRLEFAGTMEGPDEYQLEGSLSWLWEKFAASMFVYYTPGYVNDRARYCSSALQAIPGSPCADTPWEYMSLDISSLTTVDLTVTYRMDNGLRVRLGGRNIFDRAAPANVFGGELPYDPTRWDARGQVFFADVSWEI